jgi:hypothetical protein
MEEAKIGRCQRRRAEEGNVRKIAMCISKMTMKK